jgi:hypothetical protein
MMSTADSALLAFSSMWVKDLFVPYIRPQASQKQQIWFGRAMSVVGLSIGVALGEAWSVCLHCSMLRNVCHARGCAVCRFVISEDAAAECSRQSVHAQLFADIQQVAFLCKNSVDGVCSCACFFCVFCVLQA